MVELHAMKYKLTSVLYAGWFCSWSSFQTLRVVYWQFSVIYGLCCCGWAGLCYRNKQSLASEWSDIAVVYWGYGKWMNPLHVFSDLSYVHLWQLSLFPFIFPVILFTWLLYALLVTRGWWRSWVWGGASGYFILELGICLWPWYNSHIPVHV
jgi:hypothetical protein